MPELILGAIQAVAAAVAECFKFLGTPAGQELVRESMKDRAKFDGMVDALAKRLAGGWDDFLKVLK